MVHGMGAMRRHRLRRWSCLLRPCTARVRMFCEGALVRVGGTMLPAAGGTRLQPVHTAEVRRCAAVW